MDITCIKQVIRIIQRKCTLKVKCTLKRVMVAQRVVEVALYSSTFSFTPALDGGGCQRNAPAALPQGKRPGTHCTEGWVGSRAGLVWCTIFRPNRDSIPGPSGL
jgi:hypothetical protein